MRNFLTVFFTFLLYSNFTFAQPNDCLTGIQICSNEKLTINNMPKGNIGIDIEGSCFNDQTIYSEIQLFWQLTYSELVELEIMPLNKYDDLDFIIYRLSPDNINCTEWLIERCLASGPNIDNEQTFNQGENNCRGVIGISNQSLDLVEERGCDSKNDNFLKPFIAEEENIYMIKVMNFSSYTGFTISFADNLIFSNNIDFGADAIFADNKYDTDYLDLSTSGCIKDIENNTSTSVSSTDLNNKVSIFPNPASKIINYEINEANLSISNISIISFDGSTVQSEDITRQGVTKGSLDVSNLTAGIYLIRFYKSETEYESYKFVKN